MCDMSFVDVMAAVTALILWITVMDFAIFVNVCCWAAIKWLLMKGD